MYMWKEKTSSAPNNDDGVVGSPREMELRRKMEGKNKKAATSRAAASIKNSGYNVSQSMASREMNNAIVALIPRESPKKDVDRMRKQAAKKAQQDARKERSKGKKGKRKHVQVLQAAQKGQSKKMVMLREREKTATVSSGMWDIGNCQKRTSLFNMASPA